MAIKRITEQEIKDRVKCGYACTDICEVILCIYGWLYDLKDELTNQGRYRHQTKKYVEMALMRINTIVVNTRAILNFYNQGQVEKSWNQVFDKLMALTDENVLLTGLERHYSLIYSAMRCIEVRLKILHTYHFTFSDYNFDEVLAIEKYLSMAGLQIEPIDITCILEKEIDKMITKEEKKEAEKRLREGTNMFYNRAEEEVERIRARKAQNR